HQTASWAARLGWRATIAGSAAHPLARGVLAGGARASRVPDETTVPARRALTRARRDRVEPHRAARQRRPDAVGLVVPELVAHRPDRVARCASAVGRLVGVYRSAQAQALALAPLDALARVLEAVAARVAGAGRRPRRCRSWRRTRPP